MRQVVNVHGSGVCDGQRGTVVGLRGLRRGGGVPGGALGEVPSDEMGARAYALHVVFANVEVGHRIHTAEFDRGDVVGFSSFLLSTCNGNNII